MRWVSLLLVLVVTTAVAHAHGMRTGYLEITRTTPDAALLTWRSTVHDPSVRPSISGCSAVEEQPAGDAAEVRAWALRCPGGVDGRAIMVTGLGAVLTEAVVRVSGLDGGVRSHVLTPAAPRWVVPAADSWAAVAREYVDLGIAHILRGPDHLLFLLALVILVRRPRDVILTETAFTLSHTLSFSATALGLVHVSSRAAEACIALSLVLVAMDALDPRARAVARTHGPAIALVFGLVHGLGFAGALGEVGLPDHAIGTALAGFGAGVEIGQVAFLGVVMAGMALAARTTWLPRVELAGSYLVGCAGGYWLIDRTWRCIALGMGSTT